MSLKVFYDFMSPPSRALVMFLNTNKISFEPCETKLLKGEHLTEQFKKVHPFQKLPAIIDGDFSLFESVAILRYLCREKGVSDHWYPKDSQLQAHVDEYLEWQHTNTRINCGMIFMTKWVGPAMSGDPPNMKELTHWETQMHKSLDQMDAIWLKGKQYLTGDRISIADLLGICEIEQITIAGYDPYAGRTALMAWRERVRHDVSPFYEEAHGKIHHLAAKYKGIPPPRSLLTKMTMFAFKLLRK